MQITKKSRAMRGFFVSCGDDSVQAFSLDQLLYASIGVHALIEGGQMFETRQIKLHRLGPTADDIQYGSAIERVPVSHSRPASCSLAFSNKPRNFLRGVLGLFYGICVFKKGRAAE